jgi:hypothetical protein
MQMEQGATERCDRLYGIAVRLDDACIRKYIEKSSQLRDVTRVLQKPSML